MRAGLEPSPAALLSPWALAHLMAAAGQHGLSFLPLHAPEAPTAAFSVKLLKAFFTGVMIFSTMASESYLRNFKLLPEVSLTLLQLMLSSEASLCSAGLPVSSRLTLLFWTISFTFWFFFFFFLFFSILLVIPLHHSFFPAKGRPVSVKSAGLYTQDK